jgi:hypothetical protein
MESAAPAIARAARVGLLLGTVLAVTSCLGDLTGSRGAVGEATIDLRALRGLHGMSQVANDTTDDVQSARFAVLAVAGNSRREVASHLFSQNDLNVADTDSGTTFRMSFPYNTADDKFEVLGYGFGAQGDTLYRVGPAPFSMRNAGTQAGQAMVSVVVPPTYVGPGASATKLVISPRPVTTEEGKTTAVSATLIDGSGKALSSSTFRIDWNTADGSVAFFPNSRLGLLQGNIRPGSTTIVARFDPMDLTDTVRVTNTVRPGKLVVLNGNNQTGKVGSVLSTPIAVQVVSATAGFGVDGVPVSFVVTQGGGSVNFASRTTAAPNGVATVSWTLGPTPGPQLLTISVAGLPSVTASATATSSAVP